MRTVSILLFISVLILLPGKTYATDWRWEENHAYLNPHIAPGTVIPSYGPTALYDMNGDGIDELIIPVREGFRLIEQIGEFPDIAWRNGKDCFDGLEIDMDDFYWGASFLLYDLDEDDFPEIIIYDVPVMLRDWPLEQRVFQNQGDFDNPDWVRNDELFTDIVAELEDEFEMGFVPRRVARFACKSGFK